MEIGIEQTMKIKSMMTKHDITSSKQKFESDDSEGSDLNYESSLSDEDQNYGGRVQFFKQEMARFFINYPQLINQNIIKDEHSEQQVSQQDQDWKCKNRNQENIDQSAIEGKQPSASLESLAKRIALYRSKMEQTDIIDLLLREKDNILKEIQIQMVHKKSQKNLIGSNQKQQNHSEKKYQEDNMYYSWRKRKQFQFKMRSNHTRHHRPESPTVKKENIEDRPKTVQKFHKSLHKTSSVSSNLGRDKSFESLRKQKAKRMTSVFSRMHNKKPQHTERQQREEMEAIDESQRNNPNNSTMMTNWRHLVNFQPKTEVGKQLCQDIKKKNSPSDELGIKKTIIDFLVNYKELINNQVINKVTLSQKIQKLYTEDAKQLLMFYPSKLGSFDNNNAATSHCKDNSVDDKFIELLKNITEGPLIKYWRQLQESKI